MPSSPELSSSSPRAVVRFFTRSCKASVWARNASATPKVASVPKPTPGPPPPEAPKDGLADMNGWGGGAAPAIPACFVWGMCRCGPA